MRIPALQPIVFALPASALLAACGSDPRSGHACCEPDDPVEDLGDNDTAIAPRPVYGDFDALFDATEIQDIRLSLEPDAIAELNADGSQYVEGTFEHDGVSLRVGIHLKGSSTYQDFSGKPAFRVKFNEVVPHQEYAGLTHLALNNLTGDPAQGREVIAYQVFNACSVPAPAEALARVYVNDEFYGLYTVLEPVDERFLERKFPTATGDLWEANDHAELTADGIVNFELGAGAGDGAVTLSDAAATLATWTPDFYTQASTVVDMDEYLDFWAATIVTGGIDGYPYHYNDFFLYGDPDRQGRFVFMPWGQDETWNPLWTFSYGAGVMGWGCGGDTACAARLNEHVNAALSTYESLDIPALTEGLFTLSQSAVEADPRSPYLASDVATARAALVDQMRAFPSTVRLGMGL